MDSALLLKLPKWAQEYIRTVEMQRDAAKQSLSYHTDNQTVSKIFIDDLVCTEKTPQHHRFYIQGRQVTFQVGEREIYCLLREDEECLDISCGFKTLLIEPRASNTLRIVGNSNGNRR